MAPSEETSRSESSASLGGGGGGSLSGTAVKAGDFLEKNTGCNLRQGRQESRQGWHPCPSQPGDARAGRRVMSQAEEDHRVRERGGGDTASLSPP